MRVLKIEPGKAPDTKAKAFDMARMLGLLQKSVINPFGVWMTAFSPVRERTVRA